MTDDPTEKMMNNDTVVVTECPGDTTTTTTTTTITTTTTLTTGLSSVPGEVKEFQWSKSLQGLLLSCFFYGYILTQIIGGYFSDKVREASSYSPRGKSSLDE